MRGDGRRRPGHDPGIGDDLESLIRDYSTAVQRVRRLPVPAADKVVVLADLEAIFRRERVALPDDRERRRAVRRSPDLPG